MKLEETGFSNASVHFPQTVWLYMSLDSNFHIHSVYVGLEMLWNLTCKISVVLVMVAAYVGWQSLLMDYTILEGGRTNTHMPHLSVCQSRQSMEVMRL